MTTLDIILMAVLLLDLFYPSISFSAAPSLPSSFPEKDNVNFSIFLKYCVSSLCAKEEYYLEFIRLN